jgi:hypothetical protein
MVIAAFGSLISGVLAISDKNLLAEISPAMLKKLRDDGRAEGFWIALLVGVVSFLYGHARLDAVLLHLDTADPELAIAFGGVASILALIALPIYFRRRKVWVEVIYRRQHGKWRWER